MRLNPLTESMGVIDGDGMAGKSMLIRHAIIAGEAKNLVRRALLVLLLAETPCDGMFPRPLS